jgi:hypothetical protein
LKKAVEMTVLRFEAWQNRAIATPSWGELYKNGGFAQVLGSPFAG